MFAIFGGDAAVLAIAIPYGIAAVLTVGVREPQVFAASTGHLVRDAWDGLRYAWSNLTIRGLIFSISALNVAWGVTTIVIPLMVIDRLALPEWVVGVVYALSGVAGMISVFIFGRVDSRGREWRMLVYPMLPMAPVTALLLLAGSPAAVAAPLAGLAVMVASQFVLGLLGGPMDIALFTMRQRRTDPAWIGRAFAVSMALNFVGFPIGAAIAGTLAAVSLELAIAAAVVASVFGVVFAIFLVPRNEPVELPAAEVSRP
jgi:MFS family permease